ncbi:uncharacterized protein C9orf57 homolog [Onychomys torridus]|uniref:uncharacterized protein C9orf57 homolog n=1 Tax=Onychomys torridus TaxID=38674 RepID=UPI00167FB70F|nr:uncharacterized protein C9orf57 homolog [Onychomys torridus]
MLTWPDSFLRKENALHTDGDVKGSFSAFLLGIVYCFNCLESRGSGCWFQLQLTSFTRNFHCDQTFSRSLDKASCHEKDVGGVICRSCNLSIPFHGCLINLGTCRTKPGQFCIKENFAKGGIQWFSVKGCTEDKSECFKRVVKHYEVRSSHCCHRPLCNF